MSFVPPMVSALYDGNGILHVFGVAVDGSVWHKPRAPNFPWQSIPWFPLDGNLVSVPTAVCWGGPRLDVFGVGFDGQVWHKAFDGKNWESGWDSLGGAMVGPLAVVSPAQGLLNVFGMSTDGGYYLNQWPGKAPWSGWQRLGDGVFLGPPTVVDAGSGVLVVGMGMDRGYHVASWQGQAPASIGWQNLGGVFQGPPAAVSWGDGRLDVFGLGTNSAIYQKWQESGAWWPQPFGVWDRFPNGLFRSRPVAISRATNLIDVFAVGTDGFLYGNQRTASGWLPKWQQLEYVGALASTPAIAVADPTQVDVFAVRTDGAIWTAPLTSGPAGWTFSEVWTSLGQAPSGSFAFFAQPPPGQLTSSANYFMSTTGNPIPDLTVNIFVNDAIVGQSAGAPPDPSQPFAPGFSVQLNCYAEGQTSSQWQQFVFENTGTNLKLAAQYWDVGSPQPVFGWCATTSLSFPENTLPAGHVLQFVLSSADGGPTDGITNVTFSVRTPDQVWHKHDTYFIPAPKVAPIVAAMVVLVGPQSSEQAALSCGAGVIQFSSSTPLSPAFSAPTDADARNIESAESANSFYGLLSSAAAPTHIQTFQLAPIDT